MERNMALNAEIENANRNVKLESDDGFEIRNWERWWLWTPKLRSDDDGFERRNWEAMMIPNAETENDGGSERRNKKCDDDGSERRNWEAMMMALNVETENVMMMALNAETEKRWWWL